MSTNCVITFDHPNEVYSIGDTLNGYVRLQTQKLKSIRAICIKIIGYEKVSWTETHGKSTTNYSAYEEYLNSVNYVIGSPDGETFDLEPGIYEYTFKYDLPIQLPISIEEICGKIKYKAVVTIDRRLKYDNVFEKEFFINPPIVDLNLMEFNTIIKIISATVETAPLYRLCCYDSGEITFELKLLCDGFVPGQQIPFQLIVYNDSNNDVPVAEVKLMQCYTYTSTVPNRKEIDDEKQIMLKYLNNVPRHTFREFTDSFRVPHIPPIFRSKFINLQYKLRGKLNGKWMRETWVDIPITIGTIPIDNFDPSKFNLHDDDDPNSTKITGGPMNKRIS